MSSDDAEQADYRRRAEQQKHSASGGIKLTDERLISLQRRVVWKLISDIGSNLFEGKSLLSVSLPVSLFEPRSFLEKICDYWVYAPSILRRANKSQDPLFRFKLVMAFALAGLHRTVTMYKPFNPILGETFQAQFADQTSICVEQTKHHPPISHFLVQNDVYELFGWTSFDSSISGNTLKAQQSGTHSVRFANGQTVTFSLPQISLSGLLFGDRTFEYLGQMMFVDVANHIECTIQFNFEERGFFAGLFGGKPSHASDCFKGDIVQRGKQVSIADGSWLTHVRFDEKMFCEFRHEDPSPIIPVDIPLPSDCRFRADLMALKQHRTDDAQTAKVELEELQRHDAKLRKAAHSK